MDRKIFYGLRGRKRAFLILAAAVCMYLFIISLPRPVYAQDDVNAYMRTNLIRTSFNQEYYSIFEANGDTISARGRYANDRVRRIYIKGYEDSTGSYSMNIKSDGSYDASLSVVPEEGGRTLIVLLDSGIKLDYRIRYSKQYGWYFPDNGIGEKSRAVFDHIYTAPSQAAALYLSSRSDAGEIASVLEQIGLLTDGATQGIEDDYEKARAISAFIAKNYYYDRDARDTNVDADTIALYNVLRTNRTVCAGFANLFCAMAQHAGIDAVNIKGGVTSSDVSYDMLTQGIQNHEWAAFYYEKEERWVWVDAAWDGGNYYENGEYHTETFKEKHFDVTDLALSFNHRADKAERRDYYAALPENNVITQENETGGERQSVITSQALTAPETDPLTHQTTQSYDFETPAQTQESDGVPDEILIAVIIVLSVLTAAALTIVIVLLIKNNKERRG